MFRVKYGREIALKILFQIDVLHLSADAGVELAGEFLNQHARVSDDEKEYIMGIIGEVLRDQPGMDESISRHLIGWKLSRISPIDRCLIRMGMAESRRGGPKPIIIDDVIRIAKKYGEADSYKFINAILDKVIP